MGDKSNVGVAVVGAGGWGKNLVRNYSQIQECDLHYVCDLDKQKLDALEKQLPNSVMTQDVGKVLGDKNVDAVVIATNAITHYDLCRRALAAGKDVYVEKPFVLVPSQAEELARIADSEGRVLMVGHLLKYHPVVTRLKEMIDSGELGDVYYIYSQRVNLGTVRQDENALWTFAPHDLSVILHFMGEQPTDVTARGQSYLKSGVEDVVFLTVNFGDRALANIHVSWLDPHKLRKLTIVGSRKMAVFDDVESTEKLRVYDKGAEYASEYDTFAEYITLRSGDVQIPAVSVGEPLRTECNHFLDCVRERKKPLSDALDGVRIVKILDAAQKSLSKGGHPVSLGEGNWGA